MAIIALPDPTQQNPILSEIDAAHSRLSPDAQEAIKQAHAIAPPKPAEPLPAPEGGGIQPPPLRTGAAPETPNFTGSIGLPRTGPLSVPSLGSPMPTAQAPMGRGNQVSDELKRITLPPKRDGLAHTKQDTGQSGISQIHNPWARVPLQILDALGRGLFPGIEMAIPGTSGHHDVLVHQRQVQDQVERDAENDAAKRSTEVAQEENLRSQIPLHGAQAEEALAHAEALRNPKAARAQLTPHTVTTDQGVMQFNPETGRFDITVGNAPDKKQASGSVHQLADGTMFIAHPDGTATVITVNGEPAKGPQRAGASEETTDIKNYNQYKKEGGTDTFDQWMTKDANRRKPTTIINQGDKLLTPAEAAMLGVPYGTTREAAAGKQPATEAQKTTANYAGRLKQSNDILNRLESDIVKQGAMGQMVQGALPNMLKSGTMQEFEQAQRNFINAVLRRESGAVISPSEFAEGKRQYFPQPGDSPEVLAQKRATREAVMKNFIASAGNAYEEPATLGGAPQIKVQQNSKGEFRHSKDGGKTWQSGKQ